MGVSRIVEKNPPLSRKDKANQIKRNKKKRTLRIVLLFLLMSLLCMVSIVGYAYISLDKALNKIASSPSKAVSAAETKAEVDEHPEDTQKPFAVAIIGTDNRPGSGGTLNTDVLMVAVVDPSKHDVHLLSIPRDTKVKIPGYSGYRKANSAYALGETKRIQQEKAKKEVTTSGVSVVRDMLSDYLEIPVRSYVTIDFKGFEAVVDAVGGLKINVQKSMIYDSYADGTHIRISKGEQVLDGKNTLDYVRHRLDNRGVNYQSSDFERNERQQEVIKALVSKLITIEGMKNLPNVLEAVVEHTSTNLTREQMGALIPDLKTISNERISTIANQAYWDSKQSFTVIPEERLNEIRAELKELLEGRELEKQEQE